jgi:4-hydroxybenzoate polyprenyltransferase
MDTTARTTLLPAAPSADQVGRALVVDLDGTLVRTDTLLESALAVAGRPLVLLRALFALRRGKAQMKQELAAAADLDPRWLPYNQPLLDYLRTQQAAGRPLILATAADRKTAQAVAQQVDLFDAVLASDGETNLSGRAKLGAIRASLAGPFTYVGNSRADLDVWCEADAAVWVNASPRVARAAARMTEIERAFPTELPWPPALLRAMRPHQWVKNLLVFVPLVAARALGDMAGWFDALIMFIAFCATASGIYLINDLCDLAADRQHPSKARRPFASGALPLHIGLIAAPALLLIGVALAAAADALPFLLAYIGCSTAYSLWLKSQPLADVFMLAALYGLRLLAGGVASGYHVSLWLLAFSSFLFLSLAMVKRVAELMTLPTGKKNQPAGRGYRVDDLPMLQLMGVASGFVASLVLALYVQSELAPHGHQATLSWIIVPLVLFWECRVWLATARGEMHDDPIVFAAHDWISWAIGGGVVAVLLLDTVVKS